MLFIYRIKIDEKESIELSICSGLYDFSFVSNTNDQEREFLAQRYKVKNRGQLNFLLRNNTRCSALLAV